MVDGAQSISVANHRDHGVALLVTIFTLTLVSALAAAVVLTTSSETMIAANFRHAHEGMYAANAMAEWALAELSAASDWTTVVAGSARSTFVDGAPDGVRRTAGGTTVDLAAVVLGSPGWQPYSYGALNDLIPAGDAISQFYVVALVAPGPSADRLKIRALSFGPRGARQTVDLEIVRGAGGVRLESWETGR